MSTIIPSLAILGIIQITVKNKFSNFEKIIFSFAIGPAFNNWITNICLLNIQHLSTVIYLIIPLAINILLIIILKKYLIDTFKTIKKTNKKQSINIFIIILFIIGATFHLYSIKKISIVNSDQLVYAQQGKIIAKNKATEYKPIYFDKNTKFYYIAHHGLSYTLFSTTNYLYNYSFNFKGDLYFKNVNNYYFLIIALIIYSQLIKFLPKKYKKYSILGPALFLISPAVGILIYSRSIDSFRISLLLISIIIFNQFIKKQNISLLIILGIILGFSSNSHIIGFIFSIILILSLFLTKNKIKEKIKTIFFLTFITLIFGAYHYPYEILTGNGSIFGKFSTANLELINNANKFLNIKDAKKHYTIQKNIRISEEMREMETNGEMREIETKFKLIKNGILGILFRFQAFGIINWLLPIFFLIYYIKKNTIDRSQFIVFANFFTLSLIICLKGYSNYRYQLTLHPMFLTLTILYLFKILKLYKIPNKTTKKIIIIIIIGTVINTTFTFKNYLNKYIKKYTSSININNKTQNKNNTNMSNLIKSKNTSSIIDFLNNPNTNLDSNYTFLTTGTRLVNYYTNLPTYFLSISNKLYTEEGPVILCTDKNEPQGTINKLIEKYNIHYIIHRTTDYRKPSCFDDILKEKSTKIFDSGSYQVFKINNIN